MAVYMPLDTIYPSFRVKFFWNINDFANVRSGTTSQSFLPVPLGFCSKWYLGLFFSSSYLSGVDFWRRLCDMQLCLLSKSKHFLNDSTICAEVRISIDKLRDFLLQPEDTFRVTFQSLQKGSTKFLTFSRNSEAFEMDNIPHEYNDFTIQLTMEVRGFSLQGRENIYRQLVGEFYKMYEKKTHTANELNTELDDCNGLADDFRKMYEDKTLSDVVFQIGAQSLKAHKYVLCARSRVLQNMLQFDVLEKNSVCIPIVDFDLETFDHFLKFIYTGCVDVEDSKMLLSLYEAAGVYDVPCLRNSCLRRMCCSLTPETASTVLLLAHQQGDQKHKNIVVKYIQEHFLEVVFEDSWIELVVNDKKLAMDVTL